MQGPRASPAAIPHRRWGCTRASPAPPRVNQPVNHASRQRLLASTTASAPHPVPRVDHVTCASSTSGMMAAAAARTAGSRDSASRSGRCSSSVAALSAPASAAPLAMLRCTKCRPAAGRRTGSWPAISRARRAWPATDTASQTCAAQLSAPASCARPCLGQGQRGASPASWPCPAGSRGCTPPLPPAPAARRRGRRRRTRRPCRRCGPARGTRFQGRPATSLPAPRHPAAAPRACAAATRGQNQSALIPPRHLVPLGPAV